MPGMLLEVCKETTFPVNFIILLAISINIINYITLQDEHQAKDFVTHLASLEGRNFKVQMLVQGSEIDNASNSFILTRIWNANSSSKDCYL